MNALIAWITSLVNGRFFLSALSIAGLLALTGCLSAPPREVLTATPIEVERPPERPVIPNPDPIRLRDVQWRVITPETLPEGEDWVFYAVDAEGYEDLSLNNAETTRWVIEASYRLRYYRGELDEPVQSEQPEQ